MPIATATQQPWLLTYQDVPPAFPLTSLLQARNLGRHSAANEHSLITMARQCEAPVLIVMSSINLGSRVPAICYTLKSELASASIPICIVAKDNKSQDRIDALMAGASEFMEYPWSSAEVILRMGRHLNAKDDNCVHASRDSGDTIHHWSRRQELVWATQQFLAHRQDAHLPTLSELARLMGTTEHGLNTAFQELLGIRITEYLRRLRMNSAAVLLRNSALRVVDIAEISGYSGGANFTTAFRGFFGMSPTIYRQRFRMSEDVPLFL